MDNKSCHSWEEKHSNIILNKDVDASIQPVYIDSNNSDSPADAGLDLDLWYIENILTDYDSQHLQTSESS